MSLRPGQAKGAYVGPNFDDPLSGSNPCLEFKDTDCVDDDVNARICIQATDTGSGSEDIDMSFSTQVNGVMTRFLYQDADGHLYLEPQNRLRIQQRGAGNFSAQLFTSEGDATQDCFLTVYGYGNTESPLPYEQLKVGFAAASTDYEIFTNNGGGGSVGVTGNINIYTYDNTNQLFLEASSGYVGINTNSPNSQFEVLIDGCPSDRALALSHSSLAHGITDYLPTRTFGGFDNISDSWGGLHIQGAVSDYSLEPAIRISGYSGEADEAVIHIQGARKSGTGITDVPDDEELFKLLNNGTTKITVLGSGAFGIGTDSPDSALDVDGNIEARDGHYIKTDKVRARDDDGLYLVDDGDNGIFVKDGGFVGIGTTTPVNILHVYDSDAGTKLRVSDTGSELTIYTAGGSNYTSINAGSGEQLRFGIGGSDKVYIDSDGNVGIGTDSPSDNADLTLEGGALCIKETTTPTADTNYGKVYTKTDNKLYFQDGAGTEHEIAYV